MKQLRSTGIVLDIDNIDTDQIIPAEYLKSNEKDAFASGLFANWRYNPDGSPKPDFALQTAIPGSAILIAGHNFGCGSSREHAAWALAGYGIQAVISSGFADIFKGNALNNAILPIEVNPEFLRRAVALVTLFPEAEITIDVEAQELRITDRDFRLSAVFEIDPLKKKFILEDTNELDFLLSIREEVTLYEELKVL